MELLFKVLQKYGIQLQFRYQLEFKYQINDEHRLDPTSCSPRVLLHLQLKFYKKYFTLNSK